MPLYNPPTPTPWSIQIPPFSRPATQTGFANNAGNGNYIHANALSSSGANGNTVGWDVLLGAGTWDFELMTHHNTNQGIADIKLDGVSAGTLDTYATPQAFNQRRSITGIVVASTGIKRLSVTANGKNASSSSFILLISLISLTRTA